MQTKGRTETITEYLQGDHRRLDALMQRCKGLMESGVVKEAAALFGEFREGLLRHILIEEDLLFPAFEEATGMGRASGPTGVMRSEHLEIKRLMDEIQDLFARRPWVADAFEPLRSALVALLSEHNAKEERILYSMSDRMVPANQLADLVERMKAF